MFRIWETEVRRLSKLPMFGFAISETQQWRWRPFLFCCSLTDNEKQSAMCYYALARQQDTGSNSFNETQEKYTSNDFIVCFVITSDVLLDLYPFTATASFAFKFKTKLGNNNVFLQPR